MHEQQELSQNGVCHLICEYTIPPLPEGKAGARIEKALTALKDAALARAEAALPTLAARYAESTDPKKHLRHRPLFLLLEFSAEEKGRALRIAWTLSISRGGRILSNARGAMRFDKQSGYPLPCKERAKA